MRDDLVHCIHLYMILEVLKDPKMRVLEKMHLYSYIDLTSDNIYAYAN